MDFNEGVLFETITAQPKQTSPTADALPVEVRLTGPSVAIKTYTVLVSDLQESRYDKICYA